MSTHEDTSATPSGTRRLKPYQLSIAIGTFMAIFTLVSGIVPLITNWHEKSPIHRQVFGGIPGPLKLAFYTVVPVVLLWGSFRFADRMRNWERGKSDRRRTTAKNVKRRLADFRAGVYMRTLLRDSAAGLMHSMMYFGFLVLLGVTTALELDHQLPESLKFLHGDV
ncbi:MAG: iron-sulfur protein, partial [Actinomycetes bacterium]